jgi:hypothetical protein
VGRSSEVALYRQLLHRRVSVLGEQSTAWAVVMHTDDGGLDT